MVNELKKDQFSWNFSYHLIKELNSVIFSHPETLRSFTFRRDVFESMYKKFPRYWTKEDFLNWATSSIENSEEFHQLLESHRIIIPRLSLRKKVPWSSDDIAGNLSLEEMASGLKTFSNLRITNVMSEVDKLNAEFKLVQISEAPESAWLVSSETEQAGEQIKYLKIVNLKIARYQYALDMILKTKSYSVLDYGCAEGGFLGFLLENEIKLNYLGFDSNPEIIQNNLARFGEECFTSVLPDSLPRVVLLLEVLEHQTPEEAKKTVEHILNQGSELIITMPNADFNKHYGDGFKLRHPDHVTEWKKEEFITYLDELKALGYAYEFQSIGRSIQGDRPTLAAYIRSYHARTRHT